MLSNYELSNTINVVKRITLALHITTTLIYKKINIFKTVLVLKKKMVGSRSRKTNRFSMLLKKKEYRDIQKYLLLMEKSMQENIWLFSR